MSDELERKMADAFVERWARNEGEDQPVCADQSCLHRRDEHRPVCTGDYETPAGTVHPCDCVAFRSEK